MRGFWCADINRMQAFWPLDNVKTDCLPSFERLVAIHLNGREVSEKILIISAVGQDKSVAFGVIEPLDLAANHADIPLQRSPSLEYHPFWRRAPVNRLARRRHTRAQRVSTSLLYHCIAVSQGHAADDCEVVQTLPDIPLIPLAKQSFQHACTQPDSTNIQS